jgi:diphthine-ammonia ligase
MKPKAAISWSGGKDSCAALMRARADFDVVAMISMFDEEGVRSRSHGLRREIIAAQADRLGLRHVVGRCTWPTYNAAFGAALEELHEIDRTISHVVFGDILYEEHRQWAEAICAPRQLTAVEPLFGSSTERLFEEWVASGSEAIIVTTRAEHLDAGWLGRPLAAGMLPEFRRLGVDPCGERGEYHTVVTGCPLFERPIGLDYGETVSRSECWALDVTLAAHARP